MLKQTKAFSGFSVDDLQKAKEFYSNVLGLTVTTNDMGFLEVHTGGNNPIMVYPKPDHTPATFTVLNFSVEHLEKTVEGLAKRGVTFEQYDSEMLKTDEKGIHRHEGLAIAWFKDPAGNVLSVIGKN